MQEHGHAGVPTALRYLPEGPICNRLRNQILSWLENAGCFICGEAVASLRRDSFWFLNEQDAEISAVERLRRAGGRADGAVQVLIREVSYGRGPA